MTINDAYIFLFFFINFDFVLWDISLYQRENLHRAWERLIGVNVILFILN